MSFNHFELVTLVVCLAILVFYHVYLYRRVFQVHSTRVQLSVNIQIAERWILKHKERSDAPSVTLAIQTLRNSILVATFVGAGVLNIGVSQANSFEDYASGDLRMLASVTIVSACFICSFLCWVNVIRYCAHLGYLLGSLTFSDEEYLTKAKKNPTVDNNKSHKDDGHVSDDAEHTTSVDAVSDKKHVKKVIDTDSEKQFKYATLLARYLLTSFSFAFRFLFIGLPFLFFRMGAVGLIVSTGVMLIFMVTYDHGLLIGEFVDPDGGVFH